MLGWHAATARDSMARDTHFEPEREPKPYDPSNVIAGVLLFLIGFALFNIAFLN